MNSAIGLSCAQVTSMDYRKHRPWILSFIAIAFVIVAFWYARPVEAPSHKQQTNAPAPKTNKDNTPPTIGPAPGNEPAPALD